MTNNLYNTLTEATEKLKARGYLRNFSVNANGKLVTEEGMRFSDYEVSLDEFHRFEGMTDPADSCIIYALSTDSGMKGIIIDAYGADGSAKLSAFLNEVKQNQYHD